MAENKNVVDNTDLTGHDGVTDNKVNNWISQINAGGTVYDIATHHGITFKDGSSDTTGVMWNGLTDIEIVIPSITDIVQTPIEFIGTVNASGKVMDGTKEITTFEKGNLVFIAANCTFNGKVCEAGDMAIYDGSEWKVVTGENQISIVGNNGEAETTIAIGPTKDVLTVEGKKLKLGLDYVDLNKHVSVTTGNDKVAVKFGNMTVGKTYVKLDQAEADTKTIGQSITLQKASALADGTVNLTGIDTLVTDVTFGTFDAGSLQEIVLNSDNRTFSVTGGSITYDDTSLTHFVTDVSLDGDVTFGTAKAGDAGAFSLINGISGSKNGQSFVTGINDNADSFTVAGCLQPDGGENSTYIKGITGSYVTGLESGGSFSLNDGATNIVIGFNNETSTTGDVISSVSVDTTNKKSVFSGAKVNNHVLSFDTEDVLGDVGITPKYKSLKTTGYTWTPAKPTTASFATGTFKKSNDVTYTINTANETTYETTTSLYKITTPTISTDKGGYKLSTSGMIATVPANTFGVGVSGGKLPSLSDGNVTRGANVTGSVGTSLTYTNHESFNALTTTTITMPGAYTLTSSDTEGVEVGKAGELSSKNATVNLSEYLTGVAIVTDEVNA